jgi:hypothetical protein
MRVLRAPAVSDGSRRNCAKLSSPMNSVVNSVQRVRLNQNESRVGITKITTKTMPAGR